MWLGAQSQSLFLANPMVGGSYANFVSAEFHVTHLYERIFAGSCSLLRKGKAVSRCQRAKVSERAGLPIIFHRRMLPTAVLYPPLVWRASQNEHVIPAAESEIVLQTVNPRRRHRSRQRTGPA